MAEDLKSRLETEYGGYYGRIMVPTDGIDIKPLVSDGDRYTLCNYVTVAVNTIRPTTDAIKNVTGILGGIFAAFSVAVMLNLMSQSIADKTRTMGVLKAFGASNKNLAGIYACEGTVIGTVAFIIVIIALPFICMAVNYYLLGYYSVAGIAVFAVNFATAGTILALVAAFAWLGCILPAIKKGYLNLKQKCADGAICPRISVF